MNRKKIILLAASTLTAATIAVGGTLAYFTSKTAVAANTFTVGDVSISLKENTVSRTPDNQFVLTSSETTTGTSYGSIYPGVVLPKNPQITVTEDSEDCYVRMVVEVPNYSNMTDAAKKVFDDTFANIDANDWKTDDTRTATPGKYYLNYTAKVIKGQTAPLARPFESITIPAGLKKADLNSMASNGTITVNVKGEAIQAETFADSAAAFAQLDSEN